MSNEIVAYFKGRAGVAESVYQYDYGKVLVIDGLNLPAVFEAHFANSGDDSSITVIGQNNRVAIPNTCLTKTGIVTVYIYLHSGDNDGEVEYVIRFAVTQRARPAYDSTDEERSEFETALQLAIAMLQNPRKLNSPLDIYNQVTYGTPGQILRTRGNGSTEWADVGLPTDEQTASAVAAWLDAHPEATTTVEDASLTLNKFKPGEMPFITPQMFGAYGDGAADDTEAVQAAIDYAKDINAAVVFPSGTYLCNVIVYPFTELIGMGKAVLKSVDNADQSVIKSYDFDEMTGTTAAAPRDKGLYMTKIRNIIIDGNKDYNDYGYGVEIWGRNLYIDNLTVRNCKTGGIYTEFSTHNAPAATEASCYADSLESMFSNIKVFDCLGDGWDYKGPHDSHINNYVCIKCDGTALKCSGHSDGLIVEGMNCWWVKNGAVLPSGSRLSDCQIDSGGYDGTDQTGTGVEFMSNLVGSIMITNTTILDFAKGIVVTGVHHYLDCVVGLCNTLVKLESAYQCVMRFLLRSEGNSQIFDSSSSEQNSITAYVIGKTTDTLLNYDLTSAPGGEWNIVGTQENLNLKAFDNPFAYRADGYKYHNYPTITNASWTPLGATANSGNKYRLDGYTLKIDVDITLTEAVANNAYLTILRDVSDLVPYSTKLNGSCAIYHVSGWDKFGEIAYESVYDTVYFLNTCGSELSIGSTIRATLIIDIDVQ